MPRLFLLVLVVFSIFVLSSLSFVQFWDEKIIAYFVEQRSPEVLTFFTWITHVGSTWGFLVFFFAVPSFYFFKKRSRDAWFYLVSIGLLKLSISILKIIIARPRPEQALLELSTYSMPSGHASNGVLMYGVLGIFLLCKIPSQFFRSVAFLFCLAGVFLTAFSRVYLAVHYPSDVLMGMLYTAVGLWVLQGWRRNLLKF